jgi:hypothetical protein
MIKITLVALLYAVFVGLASAPDNDRAHTTAGHSRAN